MAEQNKNSVKHYERKLNRPKKQSCTPTDSAAGRYGRRKDGEEGARGGGRCEVEGRLRGEESMGWRETMGSRWKDRK